jgi:arsenate reductase
MNNKLLSFIKELSFRNITPERKGMLEQLSAYIRNKQIIGEPINLNFICTHNSRRSHLGQIWAQTAAHYYQISPVKCYSGGTDATALYPKIEETLSNSGFEINVDASKVNPKYTIGFAKDADSIIAFSKVYDDPSNPTSNFAAVMTCNDADENCPFIPGAEKRFAITYEDPKAFDHSPEQDQKYLERSTQIAEEMFYVFSQINNQ